MIHLIVDFFDILSTLFGNEPDVIKEKKRESRISSQEIAPIETNCPVCDDTGHHCELNYREDFYGAPSKN